MPSPWDCSAPGCGTRNAASFTRCRSCGAAPALLRRRDVRSDFFAGVSLFLMVCLFFCGAALLRAVAYLKQEDAALVALRHQTPRPTVPYYTMR